MRQGRQAIQCSVWRRKRQSLNEFLKESRTVQEQGPELQKQGAIIAKQQKQIEALTAALQKVSAQVELNQQAPRTVVNNR